MTWWRWWHRGGGRVEAQQALSEAHADWPRVNAVAQAAEAVKRRNGFGEAFTRAMGGRRS